MRTISYGIVHIPLVTCYRVCFCWKRPLVQCVSGSGWKMFLQSTLRLVLLVCWGMGKIDYELPQTATKIIGIYFEIGILGLQVVDGILSIASSWFENMKMLYPILVVIPVCFIVDFSVKATCYGALFLWPAVTAFGVFSLVEVWFRNFSQMYCWIAVISFIHEAKGKKNPFRDDESHATLRKTSSTSSPFRRTSSLSMRGRRSFLLKKISVPSADEERQRVPLTTEPALVSNNESTSHLLPHNNKDCDANIPVFRSLSDDTSSKRMSESGKAPMEPRHKRVGGFIPKVLRVPGIATDATKNTGARKASNRKVAQKINREHELLLKQGQPFFV